MKKIKSQESVLENLNQLRDKMKEFHSIKSDLDRKSGKIEVIFQELQDKNAKIETAYSKVDSFSDIIKDVMRDIDRISTKTATLTSKDEMNKRVSKINKEIDVIKNVIYDSKKKRSLFGLGKKEEREEQSAPLVEGSQENQDLEIPLQNVQDAVNENTDVDETENQNRNEKPDSDTEILNEVPPLEESELNTKVEGVAETSNEENLQPNTDDNIPVLESQVETEQQSALDQVRQSLQEDQIKNAEEQEQLLQSSDNDEIKNNDNVEDKISSFADAQKV